MIKIKRREYHHPIWIKDGLPIVKVTSEEHELIHQLEKEMVASQKKSIRLARQSGKIYCPAYVQLVLLYIKYLKHLNFIKALKLKKVLKIYGFNWKKKGEKKMEDILIKIMWIVVVLMFITIGTDVWIPFFIIWLIVFLIALFKTLN